MNTDISGHSPFLKWPGGKRWALRTLSPIVKTYLRGVYFEPFVGGGALFFGVAPPEAVLSDINADLINAYEMARDHPRALINRLKKMAVSRSEYQAIRAATGGSALERATRLIYLNRTGFGGIYRLNRLGQFNVPYGGGERTPAPLWERGLLLSASNTLKQADLMVCDFEVCLALAGRGDLVYCDPTYTVTHDQNCFIRYNQRNFLWSDQERLAEAIRSAAGRGCTVLLSNAHHVSVQALFRPPQSWILNRKSTVSPHPVQRRLIQEYLFLWPGRP